MYYPKLNWKAIKLKTFYLTIKKKLKKTVLNKVIFIEINSKLIPKTIN